MLETWLIEGLAEYVSGGASPPITSHDDVDSWRVADEHTNPISVHRWIDYPVPHERVAEYYPMFGLAVKYLLDPQGHGKTLMDMKAFLLDLSAGHYFCTEVFENHFGMTIEHYENHFFELMADYFQVALTGWSNKQPKEDFNYRFKYFHNDANSHSYKQPIMRSEHEQK